jgi:hypothetical protein
MSLVRTASLVAFALAVFNVLLLLILGHYDLRLGFIHLVAHQLFKPLQLLAAAFWLCLLVRTRHTTSPTPLPQSETVSRWCFLAIASAALLTHGPFIFVNFQNPFWTHLESSIQLTSWTAVHHLFTTPQSDGFYRPLTFLSLFVDYKLFGTHSPAYHFQSIALHIANAIMAGYLGTELGISRRASWAAALLFAAAPLTFEAVLWPAARFDLWATLFILLSLRVVIKTLKDNSSGFVRWAQASGFYGLALLNKESAYCVPLIVLFWIATRKIWDWPRIERRNAVGLLLSLGIVTAAMLAVRMALYHNLGGYSTPVGQSAHAHFGFKTLESLFTRVLAIGLFTANLSTGIPLLLGIGLLLFVVTFVGIVLSEVGLDPLDFSLLGLSLITALPTLNIIGWIGVNAQQSRYLYLPGIWLMLLFSRLIYKANWPASMLTALFAANILVTFSDLQVYKDMLRRTRTLAAEVRSEGLQTGIRQVVVLDLPPEANGVFFFRDELATEIREKLPGAEVAYDAPIARDQPAIWLQWNADTRTLIPVQAVPSASRTLR